MKKCVLTLALQALVPHTDDILLLATVARGATVRALTTAAAVLDEAKVQELLLRVNGEERMRGRVCLPGLRRRHASVAQVEV